MALTELESKRIERAVAQFVERRRPPPRVRSKLDLAVRVSDQSVEIFNIRPRRDEPNNGRGCREGDIRENDGEMEGDMPPGTANSALKQAGLKKDR